MQLQARHSDLKAANITVVAISVDSPAQNRRLSARLKLSSIHLYSDTDAKGAASKALGFWHARYKISRRGSIIVSHGVVIYRAYGDKSVTTLLNAAK